MGCCDQNRSPLPLCEAAAGGSAHVITFLLIPLRLMERKLSSEQQIHNSSNDVCNETGSSNDLATAELLLQADLEDVRSERERERERLLMVTARKDEFTDSLKYTRVCQWRKKLKFWYHKVLVSHCGNTQLQLKVLHSKLWFKCSSSTQSFVTMHFS